MGEASAALTIVPGAAFEVGRLVHFNCEIGTSGAPAEAYLEFVLNLTTEAGSASGTFNFTFAVNETPTLGS